MYIYTDKMFTAVALAQLWQLHIFGNYRLVSRLNHRK